MQATIRGPVWAGLPQTPQAAEYVAFAAMGQCVRGPTVAHGDCTNVVQDGLLLLHQRLLRPRGAYSRVIRSMLAYEEVRDISDIVKVPAPITVTDDMDSRTCWLAKGNAPADEDAKEAVHCHPLLDENVKLSASALVARMQAVLGVIAGTLGHLPFLPKDMQRVPRGAFRLT